MPYALRSRGPVAPPVYDADDARLKKRAKQKNNSSHAVESNAASDSEHGTVAKEKVSQLQQMSPFQEALNALTELGWALYAIAQAYMLMSSPDLDESKRTRVLAMVVSIFGHTPISFIYHLRQSLRLDLDPIENEWRRLDQASINLCVAAYCFATTGTWWYGLAAFVLKVNHAIDIWRPTSNAAKRRTHIFCGALMYLVPIAYVDVTRFYTALLILVAGCACFALNQRLCRGYGSAIFHISMAQYHTILLDHIAFS